MQLFTVRSDTWQMHTFIDVMIFTEDSASRFPSPGDKWHDIPHSCTWSVMSARGMTLHIHAHGASCLHLSPGDRKAHSMSSITQSPPRLPTNVLDKFSFHDLQL